MIVQGGSLEEDQRDFPFPDHRLDVVFGGAVDQAILPLDAFVEGWSRR